MLLEEEDERELLMAITVTPCQVLHCMSGSQEFPERCSIAPMAGPTILFKEYTCISLARSKGECFCLWWTRI